MFQTGISSFDSLHSGTQAYRSLSSCMTQQRSTLIPLGRIEAAILFFRGERVLLDHDLARLYGVSTSNLNKAVGRNRERFPSDFMFQLTAEEVADLNRGLSGANANWGGRRRSRPFAFSEQGVAMLSSVLRSSRAVEVNIEIMRAFVRLRHWAATNAELARRIDELEKKYDGQFKAIFDALRQLMSPPSDAPRKWAITPSSAGRPNNRPARGVAVEILPHRAEGLTQ